MSQLPTQRWSPSAVLGIIATSNDISCAGITQKGLPCRWDLGGEPKRRARNLLISMSQRSPHEALDDLPQLARLCLCQKNHQDQAVRVVDEWAALIERYTSSLERNTRQTPSTSSLERDARQTPYTSSLETDTRQIHAPVGHGGPSGSTLSVDEIIAELDALSLRHERLTSMLRDATGRPSEGGSARAGPSQSTPHLVNQTQQSGSPSSRDGWKRHVFGRGRKPK
jgi:hypothetical protein